MTAGIRATQNIPEGVDTPSFDTPPGGLKPGPQVSNQVPSQGQSRRKVARRSDLARGSLGHDAPAYRSALWAQVDDPVGRGHGVLG